MAALALAALAVGGAAPLASLDLDLAGLRSQRGLVQVCVTGDPAHFPGCDHDPAAHRLTVPAARAATVHVPDLPSGAYAVALIHDENGNGRLDTRFGIPTEGFGFSNNPRILFGPPSFAAARIMVGAGETDETVKLHYML